MRSTYTIQYHWYCFVLSFWISESVRRVSWRKQNTNSTPSKPSLRIRDCQSIIWWISHRGHLSHAMSEQLYNWEDAYSYYIHIHRGWCHIKTCRGLRRFALLYTLTTQWFAGVERCEEGICVNWGGMSNKPGKSVGVAHVFLSGNLWRGNNTNPDERHTVGWVQHLGKNTNS